MKKGKKQTNGSVDEHAVEEFLGVGSETESGHGLEDAKRVALVNELVCVTLVQGAGDKKDDVVNHVAVTGSRNRRCQKTNQEDQKKKSEGNSRDVIQKGGEGLNRMGSQVPELSDHLLRAFLNWERGMTQK
jgi:hypothetical protein